MGDGNNAGTRQAGADNVSIITVDIDGNLIDTIFSGQPGAAGGLDVNIDGTQILYWYDVSGAELPAYLPQDARLFIYDSTTDLATELDTGVTEGLINIDPRFGPNENDVYYTQKGRSSTATPSIFVYDTSLPAENGELLLSNANMIDYEE